MKYYILFIISFKVFSFTRATESSNQYDITNALHDTISGIFQTVNQENIFKIIASVKNLHSIGIETWYDYATPLSPYLKPVKFSGLMITNASAINPRISYEFFSNKMKLQTSQFDVQLFGIMKEISCILEGFDLEVHFNECTIGMIRQMNNSDGSSLIDLQYDRKKICKAPFPTFEKNMERILPSILQTLLSRNQKFLSALDAIHNQSIQHITSKHPHFLGHEYMYHYLIPNAFIGSLHLRDIVVKGLHNFHTLTSTTNSNTSTSTLQIKDIRGRLILEDGSRTPTSSLKLHFSADFLYIFVNQETSRVSVRAANYFFLDTRFNISLPKNQSDVIMDIVEREIERIIKSLQMPSMEYQRPTTSNSFPSDSKIENSLRQILTGTSFNPDSKISTTKSTYIDSTTATIPQKMNSSDEYDITDTLKDTIVGLFRNFRNRNVPQVIRQIDRFNYETKYNNCQDLRIVHGYLENTRIWFGFQNKTLQMHSVQLFLHLTGTMRINDIEPGFGSKTKFDRCSITVIEPKTPFEFPVVDFQYKNEYTIFNGEVTRYSITCPAEQVKKEIKSSINDMIKGNFWNKLTECFDHQPTKDIISKYPYFLGHEQEYYYLIPEALFGSFRLSNIIVGGLGNFHSLSFTDEPEVLTLEMKNIQGSLTLYESATGSSLELNFFVDSLSIGVTWKTRQINVEARNYSVFRTKINTKLSDLHSQPIIESIESAIASSILPSMMKFQKTARASPFSSKSEMETSFRNLLTEKSSQSNEKNIELSNNKGIPIPFESSNSSTILPHSITINNIQQYHLSFPNLTIIKFISGNQSHPEQIQCSLLDHSMFNHLINVVPFGKLLRNNDEAKSTNLNFNFNAPFLNVSVIKQNNSKETDSCEFQISNNQDIEIHSSPAESNSTRSDYEQLEIKKKIDATLMSMTKKRIVQTVKSMACSSFDVCTQSARIINEFFQRFVDKILKKSSLRRNTT